MFRTIAGLAFFGVALAGALNGLNIYIVAAGILGALLTIILGIAPALVREVWLPFLFWEWGRTEPFIAITASAGFTIFMTSFAVRAWREMKMLRNPCENCHRITYRKALRSPDSPEGFSYYCISCGLKDNKLFK